MLKQVALFTAPAWQQAKPIEVNKSVAPADVKRLSAQCERLLRRLSEGPVTNFQIMADLRIGNHSGRISDCRKAGCTITGRNDGGGLWTYTLNYLPPGLIGGDE